MKSKVIAIQTGARHNYAIPRALYDSGLLECFYTDLCADSGVAGFLRKYCPSILHRGGLKNLINRQIPSDIGNKIVTFDRIALEHFFDTLSKNKNWENLQKSRISFENKFGREAIKKGLKDATHVITIFGDEGSLFLKYAKENGVHTMSDMIIHPDAFHIVKEEQKEYPDIEDTLDE